MPVLQKLIALCRAKGIPVIHTTGQRRADNWDSGSWAWKSSRRDDDMTPPVDTGGIDGNEIVEAIARPPRHRGLQAKALGLCRHAAGLVPAAAILFRRARAALHGRNRNCRVSCKS